MCGLCNGESYRGVRALFNGDLQAKGGFLDRADWSVLSRKVMVHVGVSDFENEENPLLRACDTAINTLTVDERTALDALSKNIGRPLFGKP